MSLNHSSRRNAWKRLEAARPDHWVLHHCRCVENLAAAMAQRAIDAGADVRLDVVLQAATLHDIGRAITHDIRHASLGADLLRREGWDADVVECVACHTGAGIDAAEAEALGLPVRDYTPTTLEQKIVAHADNLYSGPRRLTFEQVLAKYDAKGLTAARDKIARLHTELEETLDVSLDALEPMVLAEEIVFPELETA